jgi:glycosyltransferase involved in cell wall biosynthesis
VLIEAQAMAKPIVAYDNSGMKEAVIDGETGFLVKTGDVQALAGRIGSLLRDPAQRLRFGQQGRAFILRQFAIPALIQRHEAFYLQALQPKSAA